MNSIRELLFVCLVLCIGGGGLLVTLKLVEDWYRSPIKTFDLQAKLIAMDYKTGTYSRRHSSSERYITIWDCGKYGNVKSVGPLVFKHAKPQSTLIVEVDNTGTLEIVGIRKTNE